MSQHNLFAALRAAFPADLDSTAFETDGGLTYSWRDIDRATAMVANLLASLDIPPASRVAVQVEKSVEAVVLYLATLRAGHVFLPLNTAYQSAEIDYFVTNAEPAVVVCSPANFGWVSKIAFKAGTRHVFTLGEDRSGTLLERAAHHADTHAVAHSDADDLGDSSNPRRGAARRGLQHHRRQADRDEQQAQAAAQALPLGQFHAQAATAGGFGPAHRKRTAAGQATHFAGHYGKAAALLASACSFNGSI